MLRDDELKENAVIRIQSCIRGYLQRIRYLQLMKKPLNKEAAGLVIQKCYRGFAFRKALSIHKQRFNIQVLCFLQQVELLNNDFFTKVVRTNYCVPLKSIETVTHHQNHNQKQLNHKIVSHLFPPPPPLPLPSAFGPHSSSLSNLDSLNLLKIPPHPVSSSILSLGSRLSPLHYHYHHHGILTSNSNRSPSPTQSVSKFAQVRDIFARAGTTTSVTTHHPNPIKNNIPTNTTIAQAAPNLEQARSPKATYVLNAVQQYQKQHINNHQPAFKRFGQFSNSVTSNTNRSSNVSGIKIRAVGSNGLNNNKPQNKSNIPAYVTSSPKQQPKPITRVITNLTSNLIVIRNCYTVFCCDSKVDIIDHVECRKDYVMLPYFFLYTVASIILIRVCIEIDKKLYEPINVSNNIRSGFSLVIKGKTCSFYHKRNATYVCSYL